MENNILVLISIVLAVGLLGLIAIEITSISQQAEAKGCSIESPAANASRSRCVHF